MKLFYKDLHIRVSVYVCKSVDFCVILCCFSTGAPQLVSVICYHSWKRIYLDPDFFFLIFSFLWASKLFVLNITASFSPVCCFVQWQARPSAAQETIEFRLLLPPRKGKEEARYKTQIFGRRTWLTLNLFRIALCIMLNWECSAEIIMTSLLTFISRACANV